MVFGGFWCFLFFLFLRGSSVDVDPWQVPTKRSLAEVFSKPALRGVFLKDWLSVSLVHCLFKGLLRGPCGGSCFQGFFSQSSANRCIVYF